MAHRRLKSESLYCNLGKKEGAMMLDTESDQAIAPGEAISKDVDVMVLSKARNGICIWEL
jgi:hypothetical protein